MTVKRKLTTLARDRRVGSVRWAWKGWLAIGCLAVWTGVESIGKSVFAAWMTAQFTRGELEGEWHGEPVTVLIVAEEDDIEETWMPRLMLADADLDHVAFLEFEALGPDWNVRDGAEVLSDAIKEHGASVVFIDAVLDHMPAPTGGQSINSPDFVRRALSPLKKVTRKRKAATLYSMHPPKSTGADFRTLVQNSQAFSAVPRTGLLFDFHPDDAELPQQQQRRVLIRGKGNMGRDPGALEFRIQGRRYLDDDGLAGETEKVVGVGPSPVTRADLRAAGRATYGVEREPSKVEQAAALIAAELAGGEWHEAHPIREKLYAAGLNNNNVVTPATQQLGVEKKQQFGVAHGGWMWQLPSRSANSDPPRARDDYQELTLTPKNIENPIDTVRVTELAECDEDGALGGQSYVGGDLTLTPRQAFACSCADGGEGPAPDGRCTRCWGQLNDHDRDAEYPYVWHWRQKPGFDRGSMPRVFDRDRKGERFRVLARGTMNKALIEFEDGYRTVTSRNGIRKAPAS